MSNGVNKVILVGNLCADPQTSTVNDSTVCNLRIATNEHVGGQDHAEFHNVVVWGKNAENCGEYLQKGKRVYVEGNLRYRQWEDKDGNKRFSTDIRAHTVVFL